MITDACARRSVDGSQSLAIRLKQAPTLRQRECRSLHPAPQQARRKISLSACKQIIFPVMCIKLILERLDHWLMSNTSFGPSANATFTNRSPIQQSLPTPASSSHNYEGPQNVTGLMDPNLSTGKPVLGMRHTEPVAMTADLSGMMDGPMVGGDGNNAQFWNALIDGALRFRLQRQLAKC